MTDRVTMDTPLADVVDPDLAARMERAFGHTTCGDLLHHLPQRYGGTGRRYDSGPVNEGDRITIIGRVSRPQIRQGREGPRARRGAGTILRFEVEDGGTVFPVTFFRADKIRWQLKEGTVAMFDGTVDLYRNRVQLTHPDYLVFLQPDRPAVPGQPRPLEGSGDLRALAALDAQLVAEGGPDLFDRDLLPIYRGSKTVTSWELLGAVVQVLRRLEPVPDPLDAELRDVAEVEELDRALRDVHMPDSTADVDRALRRLRFDEALVVQLYLRARRRFAARDRAPACRPVADRARAALLDRLPFTLTGGQSAVLDEIDGDLASTEPMSRLLQGEVGSGKTVVALLAMLSVVDSGRQCVLMAPTEVLAAQHLRSVTAMLGDLADGGRLGAPDHAVHVVLLTGSMSTAARRQALLDIVTGEADIVIGTHAVIQEGVDFFDLGLVVVDEQHRFGVRQRDRLREKGRDDLVPHVLVMTATPIPRTVAMTIFGDLEVSELTELPGGRRPISTTVVALAAHPAWEQRIWSRVREEVEKGHRAYVVCSRIGEDAEGGSGGTAADAEAGDKEPTTVAAVDLAAELAEGPLRGLRVGLLHGRLPGEEKDRVMRGFASGEIDVLVSTTVVEVGVDVPEATMMVVMDAERFGVSQLHQLRGRVGRGGLPGLCLLVTRVPEGAPSLERLAGVAATTDGVELSLLDLRLRREGDVLGDAQSGVLSRLRHLSVVDHGDLVEIARTHAAHLLDDDPALGSHPLLARAVGRLAGSEAALYLDRA